MSLESIAIDTPQRRSRAELTVPMAEKPRDYAYDPPPGVPHSTSTSSPIASPSAISGRSPLAYRWTAMASAPSATAASCAISRMRRRSAEHITGKPRRC